MATATLPRLRRRPRDAAGVARLAVGGGIVVVVLTVTLAAGHAAGPGVGAVAATAFLLLMAWCATHRRVDRTLAAFALYLGLLDGYVKLRTGSPLITLGRDLLVLAIAVGALVRAMQARQSAFLPPLGGFVVAFSVVVLIEFANPGGRGLGANFAGARQHLEFMPLFFLGYFFVRTEVQVRRALVVLVLCAAVGGVVSYVQSTLTPEQLADWGPGYRERIYGTGVFAGAGRVGFEDGKAVVRPFGLGSDVGAGAGVAVLALPALVVLLLAARGSVRWAMAPASVGVGLAVATSGSRAAIVTVFVTLVAFGLVAAASRDARRAVLGLAVAGMLVYGAFVQLGPDNGSSKRARSITPGNVLSTFVTERGESVAAFSGLAAAHPLGVGLASGGPASGFGRTAPVATYNVETEWNFLVVETGVAGFLIYVGFMLRLAWLAMTRIRHVAHPAVRLYLAALAAPLFGVLVAGFSGPVSVAVPYAPYVWLVAGVLAYWLVTKHRERGLPSAVKA